MSKPIVAEIVVAAPGAAALDLAAGSLDEVRKDLPNEEQWRALARRFSALGFEIGPAGPYSLTVGAPAQTYVETLGAAFGPASTDTSPRFAGPDPSLLRPAGADFADILGVVLVPARTPPGTIDPEPRPVAGPRPRVDYVHLDAPEDLVRLLNAEPLHARGIDGRDVDICVVDTGWWNHPWFSRRGLHVDVVLSFGASHPELDEVGHGTMVCASLLSLAPGARVTLVKQADENGFPAFKQAIGLNPRLIQNTWGDIVETGPLSAANLLVAETVRHAVDRGMIVVFAGGNGKKLFPSQMPEVIAVGGGFVDAHGALSAASYASGYASALFPGRVVPDVCGLVGEKPQGVYIVMPTMPGSIIDRSFAEKPYPEGDGTDRPNDGWVVISGTSSASAQVSGVIALLLREHPGLDQCLSRQMLTATARPITSGRSAEGNPAELPIPNLATGYGLVDAGAAAAKHAKHAKI